MYLDQLEILVTAWRWGICSLWRNQESGQIIDCLENSKILGIVYEKYKQAEYTHIYIHNNKLFQEINSKNTKRVF